MTAVRIFARGCHQRRKTVEALARRRSTPQARGGAGCQVGSVDDNAVAESFFATLKKELVHGCAFQTRTEAYDAISDYIENYYNAKRRHSAAANRPPIAFELAHTAQLAA